MMGNQGSFNTYENNYIEKDKYSFPARYQNTILRTMDHEAARRSSVEPRKSSKKSRGESEVHASLERIFQRKFYHGRPDFLRNPITGNYNLELDCYNSDIGLAVEYNGEQHYKYIPFFHQNKEAFKNQLYRDELKRRMCKDAGVTLIEVPYTIPVDEIESYLKKIIQTYKN